MVALALIFGITNSQTATYILSQYFTLICDDKPLLSILNAKAALSSVAAVLQHWAIFLLGECWRMLLKYMRYVVVNADNLPIYQQ